MNKILMEQNKKYRLDKVQEVKDQLDETRKEAFEKVAVTILLGATILYLGTHLIIYLI